VSGLGTLSASGGASALRQVQHGVRFHVHELRTERVANWPGSHKRSGVHLKLLPAATTMSCSRCWLPHVTAVQRWLPDGSINSDGCGFAEVIEREDFVVAWARYVPNTQFLSIPFRSELIHSAAQVSELSDCTRGFV